jgi:hypothetical protein
MVELRGREVGFCTVLLCIHAIRGEIDHYIGCMTLVSRFA